MSDTIPKEIIEAAILISKFFKKNGIDKWELMDIASRNLVQIKSQDK